MRVWKMWRARSAQTRCEFSSPSPCRLRNVEFSRALFSRCPRFGRIRRDDYGGGKYSRTDVDHGVGNLSFGPTRERYARLAAADRVGADRIRGGVDKRMAFAETIVMLRLTNILLPLAAFDLAVDLELPKRVTAITGPSGAGKTSLLEVIAGLRKIKSGRVELDGLDLTDLRPEKRAVGYVPQDLALFPHLSVERNIYYGGRGGSKISAVHVIQTLEIAPLLKRRVTEISGGEQQRIALARALLAEPRLLLLDEPLGSLDPDLKAKVLPYLCRVRDEFEIPMLYVTHDSAEAKAVAEATLTLIQGRVREVSV